MRSRTIFAAALISALAASAGTQAADAIAMPVSGGASQVPVYEEAGGFDWNGFYAGIYGVAQLSPAGGSQFGVGVDFGVNVQLDFVLVGAEVAVHGLTAGAGDTAYGQVLARAGVLVGDNALVYAAGGYGIDLGFPNEDDLLLGGGVELAVADDVTLRAQYLHGFPITGGNPKDEVTLGAHFHF